MDRRTLIVSGLASLGGASLAGTAFAQAQPMTDLPDPGQHSDYPTPQTFNSEELAHTVSDYLGVTAESAGAAIQRLFRDNGLPTAYIAGEEGSGAMGLGLRYGKGLLYMKGHPPQDIAWQGPHIASAKIISHHAPGFVHEKLLLKLRDDARRVLPTVLQQQQGVVNELIHRCLTDHTHNDAHQNTQPSKGAGKKGLNNKTPW